VFDEAVGVLEIISKTPEQRELYDARMKLSLLVSKKTACDVLGGEFF